MDFWRTARTSRLLKVRNEVIREKLGVTNNNFGENGKQYVEMVWTCSAHGG